MDTSIVIQKYLTSFTDVPYQAGMVNYVAKNEW